MTPSNPSPLIFRSLWTNGFNLAAALRDCAAGDYDGIEGPLPEAPSVRSDFIRRLVDAGRPFIAEVVTGGGYVPQTASPDIHRDHLAAALDCSRPASPLLVTVLAGCDSWSIEESAEFYEEALALGHAAGLRLAFETHRSRPTFNPWRTRELLERVPGLRVTCDFSHWCCVCERLVLDDEPDLLRVIAGRARHVHARVGYEQGPQVPHPAAPEYAAALAAHERWWDAIVDTVAESRPGEALTFTPEFGPDGYLHHLPFGGPAVADLDEINRWMARRQRHRYAPVPRASASVSALSAS